MSSLEAPFNIPSFRYGSDGCLSTGPLSPIVETPRSATYKFVDGDGKEGQVTVTDLTAAIFNHEGSQGHNGGHLKVFDPSVSRINAVPLDTLEPSRKISAEGAETQWPVFYSKEQLEAMSHLEGARPLVTLKDSSFSIPGGLEPLT